MWVGSSNCAKTWNDWNCRCVVRMIKLSKGMKASNGCPESWIASVMDSIGPTLHSKRPVVPDIPTLRTPKNREWRGRLERGSPFRNKSKWLKEKSGSASGSWNSGELHRNSMQCTVKNCAMLPGNFCGQTPPPHKLPRKRNGLLGKLWTTEFGPIAFRDSWTEWVGERANCEKQKQKIFLLLLLYFLQINSRN